MHNGLIILAYMKIAANFLLSVFSSLVRSQFIIARSYIVLKRIFYAGKCSSMSSTCSKIILGRVKA